MKSLLCLVALLALSEADTGPGVCPSASNRASTCEFDPDVNCLSDSDCRRWGYKCCPEGCGKVCKVALPGNMPIHAGSCPAPTHRLGPCVVMPNSCSMDNQCAREQKCCKEGCNRVCKTAVHRG